MADMEDVTRQHLAKLAAQDQQYQELRRNAINALQLKHEEMASRLFIDALDQARDFVTQNRIPGNYLLRFVVHVRGYWWWIRDVVDPSETACWEISRTGTDRQKTAVATVIVLRSDGKLGCFRETYTKLGQPVTGNASIYSPVSFADKARVLQGMFRSPVFESVIRQVIDPLIDLPEFDDRFSKAVLGEPKWKY